MPMSRATSFKLNMLIEAKDTASLVLERIKAKLGGTGEAFTKLETVFSRLHNTSEKLRGLEENIGMTSKGSASYNKLAKSITNVTTAQIELGAEADSLLRKFEIQAQTLPDKEYIKLSNEISTAREHLGEFKTQASMAKNAMLEMAMQTKGAATGQDTLTESVEDTAAAMAAAADAAKALNEETAKIKTLKVAVEPKTPETPKVVVEPKTPETPESPIATAAPIDLSTEDQKFRVDKLIESRTARMQEFEKAAMKLKSELNSLVGEMNKISVSATEIRNNIQSALKSAGKELTSIPMKASFDITPEFPGFTSRSMRTAIKKKIDPESGERRAAIRDIPLDIGFVVQNERVGLTGLTKKKVLDEIRSKLPSKEEVDVIVEKAAGIHKVTMNVIPEFLLPPAGDIKLQLDKDLTGVIDILTKGKLETQKIVIPIHALATPGKELATDLRQQIDTLILDVVNKAAAHAREHGAKITKLLNIKYVPAEGIAESRKKIRKMIEDRIPGKMQGDKHILKNDLVKEINVKPDIRKLDQLQLKALKASAQYAKALASLQKQGLTTQRAVKGVHKSVLDVGEKSDLARMRIDNLHGALAKMRRTVGVLRNQLLLVSFATAGLVRTFQQAVRAANESESALLGLSSVAGNTSNSIIQARDAARSLAKDGLMTITEASVGLRNLLAAGMNLKQATDLMNAFTDAAAFNRQGNLSLGEAVVGATQGIKNQQSELIDNAGITKNLSVMYREFASTINKGAGSLSEAEKRLAVYNGVMKEAALFSGDAAKAINTTQGALSKFGVEVLTTQAALGTKLKPVLDEVLAVASKIVIGIRDWISANEEFIKKDLATSVGKLLYLLVDIARPMLEVIQYVVKLASSWGEWIVTGLKLVLVIHVLTKLKNAFVGVTAAVKLFQLAHSKENFLKAAKGVELIQTALSKTATPQDKARLQKYWDVMNNPNVEKSLREKRKATLDLVEQIDGLRDKTGKLGGATMIMSNSIALSTKKMQGASISSQLLSKSLVILKNNLLAIVVAAAAAAHGIIKMIAASDIAKLERQMSVLEVQVKSLTKEEEDLAERFDYVNQAAGVGAERVAELAAEANNLAISLAEIQAKRVGAELHSMNIELEKIVQETKHLGEQSIPQFFEFASRLLSPQGMDEYRNAIAIVNDISKNGLGDLTADSLKIRVTQVMGIVDQLQDKLRNRDLLKLTPEQASQMEQNLANMLDWTGRYSKVIEVMDRQSGKQKQLNALTDDGVANYKAWYKALEDIRKSDPLEVFKIGASIKDVEGRIQSLPDSVQKLTDSFVGTRDEALALMEQIRQDPLFKKGLIFTVTPSMVDPREIAKQLADSISGIASQPSFAKALGGLLFPDTLIPDITTQAAEVANIIKTTLARGGVGAFIEREGLGSIEKIKREIAIVMNYQKTQQIAAATEAGTKMRLLAAANINWVKKARLAGELQGHQEIEKAETELYLNEKYRAENLLQIQKEGALERLQGDIDIKQKMIDNEVNLSNAKIRLARLTEKRIAEETTIGKTEGYLQDLENNEKHLVDVATITDKYNAMMATSEIRVNRNTVLEKVNNEKMALNERLADMEAFTSASIGQALYLNSVLKVIELSKNNADLDRIRESLQARHDAEVAATEITEADKAIIYLRTETLANQINKDQAKRRLDISSANVKAIADAEINGLTVSNETKKMVWEQYFKDIKTFRDINDADVKATNDVMMEEFKARLEEMKQQFYQVSYVGTEAAVGLANGFIKAAKDIETVMGKVISGEVKALNLLKIVGIRVASEMAAATIEALGEMAKKKALYYGLEAVAAGALGQWGSAAKFAAAAAGMATIAAAAKGVAGRIRASADQKIAELSSATEEADLAAEGEQRRFGSSIQAQNLSITIAPHTTISGENIFLSDGSVTELETNISGIAVEAIIAAVQNNEIDLAPAIRGSV